jgi:hypothetical protein
VVAAGPVTTPITAIAAITGTPQVGSVLTAGALTPSVATAVYQWQESSTSGGTYAAITGATSGAYTPVPADVGKYIEVVATGTDNYTGTVTSAAVGPVVAATIQLTAVSISVYVDEYDTVTLTAELTPSGATAGYQWQESPDGANYTAISGATSNTYVLTPDDAGMYIEVVATGTGNYAGVVTSQATIPLTDVSIGQDGDTLTAELRPSGADVSASYQWQESSDDGASWTPIGANSNTYTLDLTTDAGKSIKVVATGTGNYAGVVTSDPFFIGC